MIDQVASALDGVGCHRWIGLEITNVAVTGDAVMIDLVLHYRRATPVCCDQPGCYVPFLGVARRQVPASLGAALGIASPAVSIRAQLEHEPGYRHVDHATGRATTAGIDQVQLYGPDHFT